MEKSPIPSDPGQHDASRLEHLDATRAFALLLGIAFHSCLSFSPVFMGWAVQDVSTSPWILPFMAVSHSFRMETFFLLAGFFSHMAFHRHGISEFLRSRVLRIGVPFVLGWFVLRPLLVSGWIMGSQSLRGEVDVKAGLIGGIRSLSSLPSGLFTGTHLWFLYYLLLITGLAVVSRAMIDRPGFEPIGQAVRKAADGIVAWIARSRLALPGVAVPTAIVLWFMRSWGMDTPDRSLIPQVPVLLVYGGFFGLGWMFDRQRSRFCQAVEMTPWRGVLAAISIAAVLGLGEMERDPAHRYFAAAHAVHSFSYALMMWTLVFLTLGFFQKFFQKPKAWIRYLADSSYWLYLIHLPVVVWLQVTVAELAFNWMIKLALVSVGSIAVGLITYALLVRSTVVGRVLNGRRITPQDALPPIVAAASRR